MSTPTRRTLITAGAVAATGAAAFAALRRFADVDAAQTAVSHSFEDSNACVLTAAAEEGPFYVDETLIRRDLRDGRAGLATTLRLKVVDAATCKPLPGAAIDIWHCDAAGRYSATPSRGMGTRNAQGHLAPASAERFCRGRQLADASGMVEFVTIFPGWYPGRTPHIHLKALIGGRSMATSQLFFDDALTREIYARPPYAAHGGAETTNADDGVLANANGAAGSWPKITRAADALTAKLTIGIKR